MATPRGLVTRLSEPTLVPVGLPRELLSPLTFTTTANASSTTVIIMGMLHSRLSRQLSNLRKQTRCWSPLLPVPSLPSLYLLPSVNRHELQQWLVSSPINYSILYPRPSGIKCLSPKIPKASWTGSSSVQYTSRFSQAATLVISPTFSSTSLMRTRTATSISESSFVPLVLLCEAV